MSIKISLLGWSARNLRCPDHEINLSRGGPTPSPVTLVQMPNGTGKTTTLSLLRASLSGEAERWGPAKILEYSRSGNTSRYANFITSLAVDGRPLTIELTLDYERGVAKYRTSYNGIENGFKPPRAVGRLLAPRVVDLFIFDGELANALLDSRHTRAREAIDTLFQLTLFDDLAGVFKNNWERRASQVTATGQTGLTLRRNKLARLENKFIKLTAERMDRTGKIRHLREEMQRREEDYNAALASDNQIGERITELQKSLGRAEALVAEKVNLAVNNMRNPHSLKPEFASSLLQLKGNLDRLKLPSSTSKEFFEELVKEDECICGRPLDEATRAAIGARVASYLAEDEVGILNNIKSEIAVYCNDRDPAEYHRDLEAVITDLASAVRTKDAIETELNALAERRLSEGDVDLDEKKAAVDVLRRQLAEAESRLDVLNASPTGEEDEDTECVRALEGLVAKARRDVAEITHTVTLSKKTDVVVKILQRAQTKAREDLRKLLVRETNGRIMKLLKADSLVLEDVRDSLALKGQAGASVGQTLSVSYAFLATLFNHSDFGLPFVVDSPAGSLDLRVRQEVAKLVPKLCDQFVAFTISSERPGFVDALHAAAGTKVRYITMFRQTPGTAGAMGSLPPDAVITRDGVIVEGRDFFEAFDLEEEV